MPIIRKDKQVEGAGLPVAFVALTEQAATYKVTSDFFKDRYETVREAIKAYLERADCPVTVSVGEGGGVSVPGVAGYSFSQPEKLDQPAAVAAVIAALKAGTLRADDLVEIISTVKKDSLPKALGAEAAKKLIRTDTDPDAVVITMRVNKEYTGSVSENLNATVSQIEEIGLAVTRLASPAPAVEAPVAKKPRAKRTHASA